MTDLFSHKEV